MEQLSDSDGAQRDDEADLDECTAPGFFEESKRMRELIRDIVLSDAQKGDASRSRLQSGSEIQSQQSRFKGESRWLVAAKELEDIVSS